MDSNEAEPTVRILSGTSAEVSIGADVEQILAADSRALHERIIEAVRLRAAAAGQPLQAKIIEGSAQYPLIVYPDGTFTEPTISTPARTQPTLPEPAPAPAPALPTVPGPAPAPPVPAPSTIPAPAPVPARTQPAVAEPGPGPLTAAGALQPAAASPATRKPTVDDLLASRGGPLRERATIGWQGAVRRLTGGRISPRPGRRERSRLDRERSVQRRLDGSRTIVILNPKGGAHKTTSTLLLAATLGTLRGGSTLAWDNNETRGTLGWRAQSTPHHQTAVDLLENLDRFGDMSRASLATLDTYVRTQVDARFDVLASDEDAAASSTIDAEAFNRLHNMLSRYYRLIVIDTGNNMRASNWVAAVAAADQLVIVSTVREDTAASAAWLLDGLREKGFGKKIDEAVTVLASPSSKPDRRLKARLDEHFGQLTSAVLHVPFDPALVDGGPIDFDALSPETRDAWVTVAADLTGRL